MDAFEQKLKESLEHYAVPYNSADWAQMERALSSGVRGWGHGRALVAGLLVAGGLLIGGTAYFLGRDNATTQQAIAATPQQSLATEAQVHTGQTAQSEPVEPQTTPTATTAGSTRVTTESTLTAGAPAPTQAAHMASAHKATGGTAPHAAVPQANPQPEHGTAAPAPATLFRTSTKESCTGSPVDFTVEHMPEDGIYLWNFGDGSFSNKPNPQHTFTKPGSYQVMLSLSNTGMGTIHNKPSSDMIVIHEAPSANFNVVKQDFPGLLPSVHFENRSLGAKAYHWDLGDGTRVKATSTRHSYVDPEDHWVTLHTVSAEGCKAVDSLLVIPPGTLFFPNAFTPDGDGINDDWGPTFSSVTELHYVIFDRWGHVVYETDDLHGRWDGTVNGGDPATTGVYVYKYRAKGHYYEANEKYGHVTLLRGSNGR